MVVSLYFRGVALISESEYIAYGAIGRLASGLGAICIYLIQSTSLYEPRVRWPPYSHNLTPQTATAGTVLLVWKGEMLAVPLPAGTAEARAAEAAERIAALVPFLLAAYCVARQTPLRASSILKEKVR